MTGVGEVAAPAPIGGARLPAMRQAGELLLLSRPAHWVKSILVVPIALVDPALWSWPSIERVAWSTVAFILAASVVYLFNDVSDRHVDRQHPKKCLRPIAAGRVSMTAVALYGALLVVALGLVLALAPHGASWPIVAYMILNVAYSGGLKNVPLIDMGAVSVGFVLRVVQGYAATGGVVPSWLIVTVFSGSLMLLLGKRRRELLVAGVAHRPSLRGYSVELLNQLMLLVGMLCLVSTLVYLGTQAPVAPYRQAALLVSVPFVLYALSRYLQVVLVQKKGGEPVRLLMRDPGIIAAMAAWFCALAVLVIISHFWSVGSIHLL